MPKSGNSQWDCCPLDQRRLPPLTLRQQLPLKLQERGRCLWNVSEIDRRDLCFCMVTRDRSLRVTGATFCRHDSMSWTLNMFQASWGSGHRSYREPAGTISIVSLCFLAVYVKEAGDDNSPERAPCVNVAQLVQSFRRNMLWLLWRPEFWRRNISNGLGPLSRPLVRMKAFRWECKEAANPKLVGHSDAFVSVDLGTSIWVWFFFFSCQSHVMTR